MTERDHVDVLDHFPGPGPIQALLKDWPSGASKIERASICQLLTSLVLLGGGDANTCHPVATAFPCTPTRIPLPNKLTVGGHSAVRRCDHF